jgi:hypothetical protein
MAQEFLSLLFIPCNNASLAWAILEGILFSK